MKRIVSALATLTLVVSVAPLARASSGEEALQYMYIPETGSGAKGEQHRDLTPEELDWAMAMEMAAAQEPQEESSEGSETSVEDKKPEIPAVPPKVQGIFYGMNPAGAVKVPPPWYGPKDRIQPNAPILAPTGFDMPAKGDEEAIAKCERTFSKIWAVWAREMGVGKIGEIPKGISDKLIGEVEDFIAVMGRICGRAARLPDEQGDSSKLPGNPNSACRTPEFEKLIDQILERGEHGAAIELTANERELLRMCAGYSSLNPKPLNG